jgi:hypothetical protein
LILESLAPLNSLRICGGQSDYVLASPVAKLTPRVVQEAESKRIGHFGVIPLCAAREYDKDAMDSDGQRRPSRQVQETQEKLEGITDTLGLMFPGSEATLHSDGAYVTFTISGKRLRFTQDFLKADDLDHVLVMCHAAISELKRRPALATVRIGARQSIS